MAIQTGLLLAHVDPMKGTAAITALVSRAAGSVPTFVRFASAPWDNDVAAITKAAQDYVAFVAAGQPMPAWFAHMQQ